MPKADKILAIEFLLNNGFRMDAPFIEGVQYLSRDEEALAKRRALEKQDRIRGIADIDIKEGDQESLQFMEKVREQIKAWLAQGSVR
jgi:poly(A)-specific ribonuclease